MDAMSLGKPSMLDDRNTRRTSLRWKCRLFSLVRVPVDDVQRNLWHDTRTDLPVMSMWRERVLCELVTHGPFKNARHRLVAYLV